jgi:hypothetical protein
MPRINKPTDQASDRTKLSRAPAKRANGGAQPFPGSDSVLNSDEAIARRAYEIYESRGAQHGYDLDHWLEAERELKPGPTSVTGSLTATGGAKKKTRTRKTPRADV